MGEAIEEQLAALSAVTSADVQRVAQQYLGREQRTVVRLLPLTDDGAGAPGKAKGAKARKGSPPAKRADASRSQG